MGTNSSLHAPDRGSVGAWLIARLSRETSGGAFVPVVDGLRFIAIGWVVLYHVGAYVAAKNFGAQGHVSAALSNDVIYRLSSVGFFGVQLFFVISGYILATPFARSHLHADTRPVRLRQYYLRRLTRLEPPYIFNMVVLAGLLVAMRGFDVQETAKHLAASLLYVHQFVYGESSVINSVAWSLEIEVQFYLLAPLLTWVVFSIRHAGLRRFIIAGSILGLAAAQQLSPTALWDGQALWRQLHYFLVGFLLCDLQLTVWQHARTSIRWDLLGILGWAGVIAALMIFVRPESSSHGAAVHVGASVSLFVAYAGAFRGRFLNRLFSWPPLFLIGGMCYTIYLWHYIIISLAGQVLQRVVPVTDHIGLTIAIYVALITPVILVVSSLLFVMIEKPCMRKDWPRQVAQQFRRVWRADQS